jgi:hypothetical protein
LGRQQFDPVEGALIHQTKTDTGNPPYSILSYSSRHQVDLKSGVIDGDKHLLKYGFGRLST